ncbi:MAG: glucose-6-phosphate dehydrogenase assembly protein OpcA [Opitutaceae bacterium]|nr:glucose-6-phosphate dehydrogenase assembly protein OpcA [Cephaloticoccus sp.]MCP5530828.1 glucose-6-phosphate dehydrogenase assembly protein OpcA [Opitutaceae bacterium]
MSSIFDVLPGIEVPVGEISKRLARMWSDTAAEGGTAPDADDAKATQVNFVLHLGLQTTADDAAAQFQTLVKFSRRYPCRTVVLCPQSAAEDKGGMEIRAKIYGECHFGKSKSDKRCVEFVMLNYSRAARGFLENQVSICLSTDLPLYYWAHRFSASSKLADYRYLLGRAKRVLLDSAIAPEGALTYPWPNPSTLRDLVYSRLLPVRQTVGQFIAGYAPQAVAEGLKQVVIAHGTDLSAEGRALAGWLQRRLAACGAAEIDCQLKSEGEHKLAIEFHYADAEKKFHWQGDLKSGHAHFKCNLNGALSELSTSMSLLPSETALSEAMFF